MNFQAEEMKKKFMIDLLTKFNCGGFQVVKNSDTVISCEKFLSPKLYKVFNKPEHHLYTSQVEEEEPQFSALKGFLDASRSNINRLMRANKVLSEEIETIADETPKLEQRKFDRAQRVLVLANLIKRHSTSMKRDGRTLNPIQKRFLAVADAIERNEVLDNDVGDYEVPTQAAFKLVIVTDSFGKGIASLFPESFKSKFDVDIIVSNSTFEEVLEDLQTLTEHLTLSDYIMVLGNFSSSTKTVNTNHYSVAALSNSYTNIVLCTIPARFNLQTPDLNLLIRKTNKQLVKLLSFLEGAYTHVSFFDVNKWLNRSCYMTNGAILNANGRELLAKAIMRFFNEKIGCANGDKVVALKTKKVAVVPGWSGRKNKSAF